MKMCSWFPKWFHFSRFLNTLPFKCSALALIIVGCAINIAYAQTDENAEKEDQGVKIHARSLSKDPFYAAPATLQRLQNRNRFSISYWTTFKLSELDLLTTDVRDSYTLLSQRLNVNWARSFSNWLIHLEGDLFSGILYKSDGENEAQSRYREGFPTQDYIGTHPRGNSFADWRNIVQPRNAYVQYTTSFGQVRGGLISPNYALGLLYNSGDPTPEREPLFGEVYGGDRAFQLQLMGRPLSMLEESFWKKIVLFVAGSLIFRDDLADLTRGEIASELIGSLFYRDKDHIDPRNDTFVGALFSHRWQHDADAAEYRAMTYDVAALHQFTSDDTDWHVNLAIEGTLTHGKTTRQPPSRRPHRSGEVLGGGFATSMSARYQPWMLAGELLFGYSSGGIYDNHAFRYHLDGNYRVGLVLFEEVLATLSRVGYERVRVIPTNRDLRVGTTESIADGAVENAVWLNPRLYVGKPEGLLGGVGLLWGYSHDPITDAYATYRNRGRLTNIAGADAGQDLGWEVDAAIRYTTPTLYERLRLQTKFEAGILFPGTGLTGLGYPYVVRCRFGVLW